MDSSQEGDCLSSPPTQPLPQAPGGWRRMQAAFFLLPLMKIPAQTDTEDLSREPGSPVGLREWGIYHSFPQQFQPCTWVWKGADVLAWSWTES